VQPKTITPELGLKSFTCPHCGALAHQTWFKFYLDQYEGEDKPWVPDPAALDRIRADRNLENKQNIIEYFEKRLIGHPFDERNENSRSLGWQLDNTNASKCYSCKQYALWVGPNLAWPVQQYSVAPNAEMPEHIKPDFLEAASIVDVSPKGAAALLRLCIQKLVIHLGGKGDNLNADIGKLIEERVITKNIQEALDVVRVVGNNWVHPGTIVFDDNKAMATKLFGLVNVIVEATIATPRHITQIYETVVPKTTREAIAKRDVPRALANTRIKNQSEGES
jgi:hypothetical protein